MRNDPADDFVVEDDEVTQMKKGLLTSNQHTITQPPTLWHVLKNAFRLPHIT